MTSGPAAPLPRRLAIIVHGGAWDIPDALETRSRAGCHRAAEAGFAVLASGGSAVDAVEAAVRVMEEDPVFDCGRGSVLNADGEVEMDAMIMEGGALAAGSVAAVQGVLHPVTLARQVMEDTHHVMLVAGGARAFADEKGHAVHPPDDLVTADARAEFERFRQHTYARPVGDLFNKGDHHDTVGAAAVDVAGTVACATSTGGITMKRPGRVGDSPLIACGGYADNALGACSATGHGESLARFAASFRALALIPAVRDPTDAAAVALGEMLRRVGGRGGLILVTPDGRTGHACTTRRMVWASREGEVGAAGPVAAVAKGGFHRNERDEPGNGGAGGAGAGGSRAAKL